MSSDVIYYDSTETGLTGVSGTDGSVITALDAILVNGFNAKSVISMSIASGVATASISTHNYKSGRKLLIAGADNPLLNGVKKILSVPDANTVTFDATGVSDGAATGAITVKRAPLGWTKVAGDTTHGLYRRKDVTARANMLRVVDSVTSDHRLCSLGMVDSASDISTFTNMVPTNFNSDGGVMTKSSGADGTLRAWWAVGDGTSFYFFVANNFTISGYGFGDLKAYRSDDTTAAFVIADPSYQGYFWIENPNTLSNGIASQSAYVAHSYDGTGPGKAIGIQNMGGEVIGNANTALFPSPYDNGVPVIQDVPVFEANYYRPIARGSFPGLAVGLAPVAQVAGMGTVVNGPAGSGKQYIAYYVACNQSVQSAQLMSVLFDITGPWQ